MNLCMHSSSVPSIIIYGRAPREVLTRSVLTDGHFLSIERGFRQARTGVIPYSRQRTHISRLPLPPGKPTPNPGDPLVTPPWGSMRFADITGHEVGGVCPFGPSAAADLSRRIRHAASRR